MKKCLLIALAILFIGNVHASSNRKVSYGGSGYEHSLGFKLGSELGLTYKGFIFGVEGLALQTDLGIKLECSPFKEIIKKEGLNIQPNSGLWLFYSLEVNPNLVYQKSVADIRGGTLDLYAGGGVSGGYAKSMDFLEEYGYGKIGINADMGLEFVFSRFILGLDLKPGYGAGFRKEYNLRRKGSNESEIVTVDSGVCHFFDWSAALSFKWSF